MSYAKMLPDDRLRLSGAIKQFIKPKFVLWPLSNAMRNEVIHRLDNLLGEIICGDIVATGYSNNDKKHEDRIDRYFFDTLKNRSKTYKIFYVFFNTGNLYAGGEYVEELPYSDVLIMARQKAEVDHIVQLPDFEKKKSGRHPIKAWPLIAKCAVECFYRNNKCASVKEITRIVRIEHASCSESTVRDFHMYFSLLCNGRSISRHEICFAWRWAVVAWVASEIINGPGHGNLLEEITIRSRRALNDEFNKLGEENMTTFSELIADIK